MKSLLLLLLVVQFVSAGVVINQVLYDPVGTESGGEAVELKNAGSSAVDISGCIITTESSSADATVPDGVILQPGSVYLVADVDWDSGKDDDSWRSADYEERITLGNSDSGVALLCNGSVVDAVGWGDVDNIEDGLYEGSPAVSVAPGRSLLRTQDTDDNSRDFVDSVADFQPGIPVPVSAEVSVSVPVIEVSKSLNLAPEGVLSVRNNGDSAVGIRLVFNDFVLRNYTISKSAVSLDCSSEFVVNPSEEKKCRVGLRIPVNALAGKYTSTLRVIIAQTS